MRQGVLILWNALTNYAREAILLVLTLVVNPFLYHRLGADAFGVVALTGNTVGFFYLLDIGMGHAVARFVSKYAALSEVQRVRAVVSTAVVVYVFLGAVVTVLVGGLGLFLLPQIGVPASVQVEARWVIVLLGLGLGLRFVGYAFEGTLRGLQRFDICNLALLAERVVYAGTSMLVVGVWKQGLLAVGYCLLGSLVVVDLIWLLGAFAVYPSLQVRLGSVSRAALGEMLRFGALAALTQVTSFLERTATPFLISSFFTSTVLGHYNLVMVVVTLQLRLATAVSVVVMPAASRLEALNEGAALKRLVLDGSRAVLGLVVPSAIWMMVMAAPLLETWIGPTLGPYSGLLVGLAAVQLVDSLCGVGDMVLLGMGRARPVGGAYLVSSALMIGVLMPLLWATPLGLYAVPVAMTLGVLIRRWVLLAQVCRAVRATVSEYVLRVLAPLGLASVFTAGALFVLRAGLPARGWGPVLLSAAVGGTVHLAVSWWVVLRSAERAQLQRVVRERWRYLTASRDTPAPASSRAPVPNSVDGTSVRPVAQDERSC